MIITAYQINVFIFFIGNLIGAVCGYWQMAVLAVECIPCFCMKKMRHIDRVAFVLFEIILSVLFFVGKLEFNLPRQVLVLYTTNNDIFFWIKEGHIHSIRYLISCPGIWFSEIYGLPVDIGFGAYVVCVFGFMYLLILKIFSEREICSVFAKAVAFIFVLTLVCVMHGRAVFPYMGMVILVYVDLLLQKKCTDYFFLTFCILLSLLLSAMSSGTMFLLIGYAMGILVLHKIWGSLKVKKRYTKWGLVPMLIGFCVYSFSYVLKMLNKAISYYDGIYGMLQHGMGKFLCLPFQEVLFVLALLILILNVVVFYKTLIATKCKYASLYFLLNLALYGSLFGRMVGAFATFPLFMLFIMFFRKPIRST